jgi:hypothetical protein
MDTKGLLIEFGQLHDGPSLFKTILIRDILFIELSFTAVHQMQFNVLDSLSRFRLELCELIFSRDGRGSK